MNKRLQKLMAEQPICTGNVCTDMQWSSFIRPQGETACNGFTFPPGELRRTDLKAFARYPSALALARRHPDQTTILYVWRTRWAIYGASITDANDVLLARGILSGPNYSSTVLELERAAGIKYATAKEAA